MGLWVYTWGKDIPSQETQAEKTENVRSLARLAGDPVRKGVGSRCESPVIPGGGLVLGLPEVRPAEYVILVSALRRIGEFLPFPVLCLPYFLGYQRAHSLAPSSLKSAFFV